MTKSNAKKASRIMNSFGIAKIPCYRAIRRLARAYYIGMPRPNLDIVRERRHMLRNLRLSKQNGVWRKS